jgi:thiosulfate/3-mercaptopyruvate sulfurtransferase
MARRHGCLVDAATVAAHLDDARWVLVDCRAQLSDPVEGPRRYAAGHLPGARFAHLDSDLSGPVTASSGRHPLPDAAALADRFGRWGIGNDSQIVAYDDAGGAYAARLWWLARWLGHEQVAVLDGGVQAWTAAGYELIAGAPEVRSRHFIGAPRDDIWLETDEVLDLVQGEASGMLIDVRGAARYAGREEPIDPVAGHIAGAVNLPFTGNLGADGRFLAPSELAARYAAALGARSPSDAVAYCGSGVTACHALLAMEHAGLHGARLYAGSWSEWLRDPARPLRTGAAP